MFSLFTRGKCYAQCVISIQYKFKFFFFGAGRPLQRRRQPGVVFGEINIRAFQTHSVGFPNLGESLGCGHLDDKRTSVDLASILSDVDVVKSCFTRYKRTTESVIRVELQVYGFFFVAGWSLERAFHPFL